MEISTQFVGICIAFAICIAVGVEGTALGGDCSSVACADANAECPSNVCVCKSGYFHKSDDVCTIKVVLDSACVADQIAAQCADSLAECRDDSGLKCKCTAANYDNSGTCTARKAPEVACTGDQCVTHATCDTTCQCDAGYTASPTTSPTMCSANGVIKFASFSYMYLVPIFLSMMSLLR